MGTGAVVGAVRGVYVGVTGGELLEPLGGGLPGAVVGGVVGGIFGAAASVFSTTAKEPFRRMWYDYRTYNPAINRAAIDCDAEARGAVFDAQFGGKK